MAEGAAYFACASALAPIRSKLSSIDRMTRAGFPPTRVFAGTSLVTTEPAATTEFSPTVTPAAAAIKRRDQRKSRVHLFTDKFAEQCADFFRILVVQTVELGGNRHRSPDAGHHGR